MKVDDQAGRVGTTKAREGGSPKLVEEEQSAGVNPVGEVVKGVELIGLRPMSPTWVVSVEVAHKEGGSVSGE